MNARVPALKTAAVLTISDSSCSGKREDLSGPAIVRELETAKFKVLHSSVLPDEKDAIAARLIECSELDPSGRNHRRNRNCAQRCYPGSHAGGD